jgi:hypothetical protein
MLLLPMSPKKTIGGLTCGYRSFPMLALYAAIFKIMVAFSTGETCMIFTKIAQSAAGES